MLLRRARGALIVSIGVPVLAGETPLIPSIAPVVPLAPRAALLPVALSAVRITSAFVAAPVTVETPLTTPLASVPLPPLVAALAPVPPAVPLIAIVRTVVLPTCSWISSVMSSPESRATVKAV